MLFCCMFVILWVEVSFWYGFWHLRNHLRRCQFVYAPESKQTNYATDKPHKRLRKRWKPSMIMQPSEVYSLSRIPHNALYFLPCKSLSCPQLNLVLVLESKGLCYFNKREDIWARDHARERRRFSRSQKILFSFSFERLPRRLSKETTWEESAG